jgi:hypothetical protein
MQSRDARKKSEAGSLVSHFASDPRIESFGPVQTRISV